MKKIFVPFLIIISLLSISGCGAKEQEAADTPISLVIIAGRHANANMYTDDMLDDARQLIERSIIEKHDSKGYHAEAHVSVIVSDGDPQIVPILVDGESLLECNTSNKKKFEEGKEKIINSIIEFLCSDDLRADDPEVDLLEAIDQAQKILNFERDSEHHILILDTGITTSGYLDMRNPDLDIVTKDIDEILTLIQEGVPNLEGTQVTFIGLGNVCGNQQKLGSKSAESNLKALWTAIIESVGGGNLTYKLEISSSQGTPMIFDDDSAEIGKGYPPVGTVFFPQPDGTIDCAEINIDTKIEPDELDEPIIAVKFHTSDLGFEPNKATFRDINQIHHAINTIASKLEKLLNETDYKIYVVGSIAKISPDRTDRHNQTSLDRAQAVANKLIEEYGVPVDRIVVIDAGVTEFSWRNANEDDGPKQANRVVAIISENTADLVQELKKNGYIN